ncbi:RNA polymerase, sigma-24 subunit, ECF subfamily [Desulfofarcimen acetoxidans DSM 771]|jgi:RNA polymerase sigma factor (sigma-70 family)|uniref:RNA polymerase, sigma-24 subunit, ECF subfamily n=1 Tax=Desulfofarcimen acetoxidans (strain ATCC 49208 / DSM 771 / KCTC 5769 / VKM B-1644 / 5575) TaxID=485916 RepID=C8VXK2_DESAS|nr:RNA polymerase sigma factor SigX [Desulfofarcimen acetoxidans]ACV62658.1 RNA polymerase, sigma-24 subunit, ECF subfamily [Desulfofarcimen acetoxidans DSM 771]
MDNMPVNKFKAMFDDHYPTVCRQLTYLLGNRFAAEDVAQETFLKLYRTPPRDKGNLAGWLFRVSRNLAFDYLRSEKSRGRREERNKIWSEGCTEALSCEEAVMRKEAITLVHQALQNLSERDRACLLLRFSGAGYEEIAEITGIKYSSVGTVLARARARFKQEYCCLKGSDD